MAALLADTWVSKAEAKALRSLSPSLAARRNDNIPDALVRRANAGRLFYEARVRLRQMTSWEACMYRNSWFGKWSARQLESCDGEIVFSYSYSAQWQFQIAKKRGMRCVLDLIDLGWMEEKMTRRLAADYLELNLDQTTEAPKEYWDGLRSEIEMADKIIVNSEWSKSSWIEVGVPAAKLIEIPVVYNSSGIMEREAVSIERQPSKRLKALFLGSVILRKGVGQLFEAMKILRDEPVEFTFAGPIRVKIPDEISAMANVRFIGTVDKLTAKGLYQDSDFFLFPTLSDGFGLTQLEALGHGLPVISSKNCALVIEDRVNGLVLNEVSPVSIAEAIMELVLDPVLLARLKSNACVPDRFHPRHLAPALLALEIG